MDLLRRLTPLRAVERTPRPMPVAGLLDRIGGESELGDKLANLVEREGGVEGVGEELPLVVVAVGGVSGDEVLKLFFGVGS